MAAGDNTNDMIATVLHRLGDPGGDQWDNTGEIVDYLNASQRELLDLISHRALFEITSIDETTLGAGTSTYSLPSDFGYPLRVRYKDVDATLWALNKLRALRQNTHHTPSEDDPYAVIWDDKLELFVGASGPTQAGSETVKLWYIAEPTAMVASSTDMDFGNQFRHIVETGAVARALEQADSGNYEEAEYQRTMFEFLCSTVNLHYGRVPSYEGFPNDPVLNPEG